MSNNPSPDNGEDVRRKEQSIVVYQFNDQIGDFEELIIDPNVKLPDLLDEDFILLFVDPQHYRVWLWHGFNTTTRMKFIAAKMAASIRDKHGIAFKITTVDQDNESTAFKVMIGLEEAIDYDAVQTGPAYEGTREKSEEEKTTLSSLSIEKLPKNLSKRTRDHLNSTLEFLKKYQTTLSHYDILLIEDDLASIRLLTAYFESQGVTWKVVTSGTKGLEELENNTPKVVLLDIILPEMSGFDICNKIKSNPKMKHIPVFLLGSISRSEIEKHLGEAKADGYILKGFDFSGDNGDDRFPYPYIYKPPKPPDDIEPALKAQRKIPKEKEEPQTEQECPYCGSKLPNGQKICPICGKDVF